MFSSIFLLPNGTFLFELVIFIVVLGVIAKFILPPIQKTLDERARIIRDALRASDEGQHEAEALATRRIEVLTDARSQARSLLEAAGREVEEKREDARQRGQVEHDRIVAASEATISQERDRVRGEVIARLDAIVVAAAEQVIGTQVDATRHAGVIRAAIAAAQATAG